MVITTAQLHSTKPEFRRGWGVWFQSLFFLGFLDFFISTSAALDLLSIMGSVCFGHAVQEILRGDYLKTNFESLWIKDFVPAFWKFVKGNFCWKSPIFWTLNFKRTCLESRWFYRDEWAHSGVLSLGAFVWYCCLVLNFKLKKWSDMATLIQYWRSLISSEN